MTHQLPHQRPDAPAAARSTAWTGNVILSLAVVVALALALTSWLSYDAARDASDALMRAEAQQVGIAAQREVSTLADDATPAATVLASFADDGLRYVAIRGPDGSLAHVAGTPIEATGFGLGDSPPSPRRRNRLTVVDGIVRLNLPPRARRGRRGRRGGRGGGPAIVVELEPKLAGSVGGHATRTLVVSLIGALVCLLGGLLVRSLWNRRVALQARLADKRQLESLGEMAAVMAHEMRNPLASLKGNLQLLAERFRDDERAHAKVERVVGEATRLEQLTNSLLTFIRSGRIELKSADPVAIIERVRLQTSSTAIVVDADKAPPLWTFDPDRVEEAVTNLLVNAVDVSPQPGSIQVQVVERAGALEVSVRDQGPGFQGDIERLFEPFTTTKTRGTGLGLAVSRQIAEAHGGTLTATNHAAGGAVVVLRLPRHVLD